jgi:cytochrome c oxidase subunit 2
MQFIVDMMPNVASEHGPAIDNLIQLVHLLMAVLFVGWGALFTYILWRFRKARNPVADAKGLRNHYSTYAEVGVAVVEVVLLVGFSIPLWAQRVDDVPAPGDSLEVRAVAEQFAWNFHYPGPDGVFGATSLELINAETNPLGLDRDDPNGADDITTINQLHLPVDQAVVVYLSSKDVIHSFALPHMRVKQDAVPGLEIPVWWVPTKTTEQMREELGNPEFTYEISCAQLCGIGHYSMRGFYTIHTQEGYDAWLAEEAALIEESAGGDDFWN